MRACTMGVPPSKYRSPACSTCALALMCASLSGSVRPGQAWLVRHWSTSRRRARIADPQWHHSRMIPPVSCSLSAGPVMASHFCTVFCLIIEQSAQCQGTKKGHPLWMPLHFVCCQELPRGPMRALTYFGRGLLRVRALQRLAPGMPRASLTALSGWQESNLLIRARPVALPLSYTP